MLGVAEADDVDAVDLVAVEEIFVLMVEDDTATTPVSATDDVYPYE